MKCNLSMFDRTKAVKAFVGEGQMRNMSKINCYLGKDITVCSCFRKEFLLKPGLSLKVKPMEQVSEV